MKELSSSLLYYRSLATLIFGPVLLCLFVNSMFYKTSPLPVMLAIYCLLALIFIRGWLNIFKFKKVFYDEKSLLIKSFFTDETFAIPINEVISIQKVYGLLSQKRIVMYYKISYTSKNSMRSLFFYKAINLYEIDDFESYIGIE